ncbi:aspartyl-phosphate phosphatase Spo0E family protein [Sporomusa acidovorans]|uniref:Spo0E like sporulation regulatory protein n=1 Tax=Sporomusa acidovorans (strain ATCC 49682 / DSM 3132 / Mol) TaxID=1123286 RepID=A0ABZ3J398_SPOA4|nr:aspartyl-phosphate phosphatase Spo0E family protein [Sporomusa acidovorans]OZC20354.1 Spo0E like sporulation regulatory protein [Sporomusa acidovorans DSM 3132]SDD36753.1 Spo0E like sporulation regulatory protein [Sporomusa acidovorans]
MPAKRDKLLHLIEELREELQKTVEMCGMNSPQALAASQQLDIALNQYNKLTKILYQRCYHDRLIANAM